MSNSSRRLTRRGFVVVAAGAGAAAFAACSAPAAPTATPVPAAKPAAPAPAAPTTAPAAAAPTAVAAAAKPTAAPAAAPTAAPAVAPAAAPAATGMIAGPTGMVADLGTKEMVSKIIPLSHKGELTFWHFSNPNLASEKQQLDEYWKSFKETYPNINLTEQFYAYDQLIEKTRVAVRGGSAPDVGRMAILWGSELAGQGHVNEIDLKDFGYKREDFWPGALKSATWKGKLYGIPTNNETMGFIWNSDIFRKAGLDPEKAPATWDDVVEYSAKIKQATGKSGFGLIARLNHGNTPFRFMPVMWAFGGGALDEAEDNPAYEKVYINNEGSIKALEWAYNLYVRDKSVPVSALTNSQGENLPLFLNGEIAMMIGHPSEYPNILQQKPELAEHVRYGLYPSGPVRRAAVFGGSNIHIFKGTKNLDAAKALVAFTTSPEWSTRLVWQGSNPGHRDGFKTTLHETRLKQIKFLNISTEMLQYGVPFPVIPEATEIMNVIVPSMLQDVLTGKKSPKEAADSAADAVKKVIARR
jgi:multiple sugar transport system substrate-binding protein